MTRLTVQCMLACVLVVNTMSAPAAQAESLRETAVVRAFRSASPSVVNIHGQKTVRATAAGFAGATPDSFRQVNGMGTGVVVDPRGYIVTNFHVVEDVADIRVTLKDERTFSAELIASSKRDDLAVIKITVGEPLPVIPRGSSEDLMVGEPVLAIGNAFGYENTLTQGIISALHRDVPVNETQSYRNLIQTSAGINPGNSGGPLLNIEGQMIGINVAVRVGAQQIAFTIPVDQALETVTEMIEQYNRQRSSLGIEDLLVSDAKDLQIAAAGSTELEPGDRIVRIGDRPVSDRFELALAALDVRPGESIAMQVQRDGTTRDFTLVAGHPRLDARTGTPAELVWEWIGIRAEPLNISSVRRMNSRLGTNYKGGLRITSLRSGSPAARQGIEPGDVLLGIHEWRTATLDDLEMIVEHPELQRTAETKFYILRSNRTLYGFMRLANRPATHH
ncbi:trypsin-like peptidase domain-containing protein [Roseimaritima sediminicola]|uniref:trypsin-like peptidase domain-containing protein n=1 Tax=Roseimaritima sediminicola TaxID=2662066 RepID=UPI001386A7DB|nr:trypsin-like peptidase domain-containing protein [Roseimaritima sediminicola]